MSQQYRNRPIQVDRFRGGETSRHGLHGMKPGMSHLLENCFNTENETVKKAPGFINVRNVGATKPDSAYEFILADGTTLLIATRKGSGIGHGFIELLTGAQIGTNFHTWTWTVKASYATMNNKCYVVTGDGDLYFYPSGVQFDVIVGATINLPTEAFKLHVHKNRMWVLDKSDKLKATFSALNDPTDYATPSDAGYIDFSFVLGHGDELLDMATFVNYLVFFFRNHIAIYSGSDPTGAGDFNLVQLIQRTGVTQTEVVQPIGSDIWYIHDTGIKSLRQVVTTGAVNVRDVSEIIDEAFVPIIVNATRVASAHYPARKWVMFLADEYIWIYDYGIKAWFHIKFFPLPSPFDPENIDIYDMLVTAAGVVYFIGYASITQFDVGLVWNYFNGQPEFDQDIEMEWNTANIQIAAKGNNAFPSMLEIHVNPVTLESGTILVSWEFDHNGHVFSYPYPLEVQQVIGVQDIDAVTDWDAIDPLDGFIQEHIYVPLEGEGKTMDITIRHSFAAEIEIEAFVIERIEGGM